MIWDLIDSTGRIFITIISLYSLGTLAINKGVNEITLSIIGILMMTWCCVPMIKHLNKQWKKADKPTETEIYQNKNG